MANETRKLGYYVTNVYTQTDDLPEAEVKSLVWPVNRILSMDNGLLEHIAYVSKFMFTLEAKYYKLLMRVVGTTHREKNLKYLKVEKKSDDEELLVRYVQYFKLSKREVRDYLKILFTKHSQEDIYGLVGLDAPDEHS